MDLTVNQPPDQAVDYLTPPTCQYSQGSKYYPHYCGKKIRDLKEQTRGFRYYDKKLIFPNLPNPLWLAAKYGGFIDANGNGLPDPGEWEGPGGDPANYFHTSNMSKLSEIFGQAFRDIANSSKSAKAIASFMDSWPTKGISIQTSYYPEYVNPTDSKQKTTWVGSVYALFVDKWGNFREDSDGDAHLTYKTDPVSQTGDRVIGLNNPGFGNGSNSLCYEAGQKISRCEDIDGNNNLSVSPGTTGRPANIHRLKSLWDAGQWLSSLDTGKLLSGSRPFGLPATAYNGQRLVYYGQPISSGRTELRLFDAQNSLNELEKLLLHPNFAQVLPKSGTLGKTQTSLRLIQYILGADQPDWRSRTVGNPWTDDKSPVVWRLGDVMNSKPAVVGPPSSNYDLIYDDDSYAAFKKAFANRRHMVYFGSNDGLLHAVNAGFLGTFGNGQVYYQTQAPGTKTVKHELGAEVWAYVPTSLLPHLQWMADPQYSHAFYVDMKPLISDLKIKGQWRTVLFGGLRLGGRPIEGPNPGGVQDPHFFSELFALDITDPESPPVLLWRYSSLELGLALGQPTVVSSNGKWYVLIGSGPVTDVPFFDKGQPSIDYGLQSPYGGVSHQNARIIVLEADTGREAVNTDPVSGGNPDYLLASEKDSFFNEPFLPVAQIKSPIWNNHTVYYGLTQSRDLVDCTDKGAVYRIEMAASDGSPLPVEKWKLRRLINTERPVTGAVNSTYDSRGQLWVLFGTGRLWSLDDVSPCTSAPTSLCHDNHQQFIYGIKEELNKNGYMAFSDRTSEANRLLDLSGAIVYKDGRVANLINQPLLLTGQGGTSNYDIIYQTALSPSAVGYKRMLDIGKVLDPKQSHAYEMLISQPKLMPIGNGHSALSFTSFEPSNYSCGELGHGYLYMLDTFTGLPKPAFRKYFPSASASSPSSPVDPDLVTGAIQTGPGRPTESSVFAGDGKMIVRASSSSGGIFDLEIPSAEALGSELISWREVFDMGFDLPKDVMTKGF
jgi:type IV pilus assembly protein PilY1